MSFNEPWGRSHYTQLRGIAYPTFLQCLDIPVAFLTKNMVSYICDQWTSSAFVLLAGIFSLKDNKENHKDPLIFSLDNHSVTGALPVASYLYVSP